VNNDEYVLAFSDNQPANGGLIRDSWLCPFPHFQFCQCIQECQCRLCWLR